ncbi:MAG: hypothetical protein ACTSR8_20495 [Promethearchaeota archaeon]
MLIQQSENENLNYEELKINAQQRAKLLSAYANSLLTCGRGSLCELSDEEVRKSDMVRVPYFGWICMNCFNEEGERIMAMKYEDSASMFFP